ncbi:MAG: glycosyltransferase family 2 protein [Anaerolineae bacterium]
MPEKPPRISVVTPSYNRARFLEEAMLSVLDQGYPNLEYVIIDGGSTDGSVDIIRRYEDRLAYWVSEPDNGHGDALSKGFAKTGGEVMGWLNSDDLYTPWAFSVVAEIFSSFPQVEWISSVYPLMWNAAGQAVACTPSGGFNRESFFRGANLPSRGWYAREWIQQESTFWRRSLWERAGAWIDLSCTIAVDFELWTRFYDYADLYGVAALIGGFRLHGDQKTTCRADEYLAEAEQMLQNAGGRPYGRLASIFRRAFSDIFASRYPRVVLRPLGSRLARLGLLYPVEVCVWRGGKWEIVADHVV